eukprot:TRINITY_DN12486_c0_g1_i1.p1 TRINITY_DN12486_c0_g1~~TRINITY_DN12486_c0_g1_i1.p1  ORF type:complete len:235 (+),score=47.46 TRINITY_DN12486_c0_g1_i1:456-1160(+)
MTLSIHSSHHRQAMAGSGPNQTMMAQSPPSKLNMRTLFSHPKYELAACYTLHVGLRQCSAVCLCSPEEQSSKRRPKALRQVVANTKKAGVDPRFQAYAGTYRPQAHDEAYRFLDETRETEFADVKRALRKHKQGAKHDELKRLLQSMKNKAVHRAQSRAKWEGEKKKRKLMQAQGLIDKEGKSKFHLKRSDQRKLEMLAKFESLKAKGQLKKAVKQRRKHNIQKERKALPDVRA